MELKLLSVRTFYWMQSGLGVSEHHSQGLVQLNVTHGTNILPLLALLGRGSGGDAAVVYLKRGRG